MSDDAGSGSSGGARLAGGRVPFSVRAVGGPTALLDFGRLRIVTDPTFDGPGDYVSGSGSMLVKTLPAAMTARETGPVDLVLLSHDTHSDNLDRSGRAFLSSVPLTLTTPSGAGRLSSQLGDSVRGLAPWTTHEVRRPDGGLLVVTSVPARHGPEGSEPTVGEVAGFVLTADDLPTVYVSGDNAWLGATRQVAERFGTVDTALLFAGGARTKLFDGALLTLDSAQTAEAAALLGVRKAVPVHFNSWQHFSEGGDELRAAFADAGLTDRLVLLNPGESAVL